MALHIVRTEREEPLTPAVERALRAGIGAGGRATLLLPTFSCALSAQRELASMPGLGVGVEATTASSWAAERWGVWGDGRRVVDGISRDILCLRVVSRAASRAGSRVRDNEGTRGLLAGLVSRALPELLSGEAPCGLSDAEAEVAGLARDYARELEGAGLVEPCEVLGLLPGALSAADASAVVASGLDDAGLPQLRMLARLARDREVTFVCRATDAPADELGRLAADQLLALAAEAGVPAEEEAEDEGVGPAGRPGELAQLVSRVFRSESAPIEPTGSVRVLLPAGPSAEPEAIACEAGREAGEGCRSIAVLAPDAEAAWRELSPRLAARGIGARTSRRVPLASLEAGRAFLELIDGVSCLVGLLEGWPAPVRLKNKDLRVELRDMSWWPPRGLSDFLASRISGVDASRARALDARWRANRLLTPQAVLDQLQNERATSAPCAAAVRELLRGRVGSCASKLLQALLGRGEGTEEGAPVPEAFRAEATAVLSQALSVGAALKECGISFDAASASPSELSKLLDTASAVLRRRSVTLRASREVEGARAEALICVPSALDAAPLSFDAVIVCGQTSVESPVSGTDDALAAILRAYGALPERSAMARARRSLDRAVRAARRTVVLERCLFSADSKECFPSVAMGEALACYGLSADASASDVQAVLGPGSVASRGETDVCSNAAATGEAPAKAASCPPAPAGKIDPGLASCVTPPQEGSEDASPLLSASQIETYLECPYKWFSLRRLRLRDSDAGFTGAETGTFAHRVLEVTHRNLLASARAAADGDGELARLEREEEDGMQSEAYVACAERLVALAQEAPSARLAGSRVDLDTLGAVRDLMSREFDGHLAHQFQLTKGKRPKPQALVAHTAAEEGSIAVLRRDLTSLLGYEAGILSGFEPRFFEWGFGKRGAYVEYAGVQLTGTVDRIDVDAHGQAAVIDYKHKGARGFAAEYDAFGKEGWGAQLGADGLVLPRRVQSLIYGQVVRRAFPQLKVVSSVYLCTKPGHELAGAVDAEVLDNVFGAHAPSSSRRPRLEVPRDAGFGDVAGGHGMESLLDACEEKIAAALGRMLAGDIEARPIDAHACDYCPVLNCEKRCSK